MFWTTTSEGKKRRYCIGRHPEFTADVSAQRGNGAEG